MSKIRKIFVVARHASCWFILQALWLVLSEKTVENFRNSTKSVKIHSINWASNADHSETKMSFLIQSKWQRRLWAFRKLFASIKRNTFDAREIKAIEQVTWYQKEIFISFQSKNQKRFY